MNIVKISQKKLNNPEKLLKGRASVSFSDINGLLIRIFRQLQPFQMQERSVRKELMRSETADTLIIQGYNKLN